jgi:hypothetical protein
MRCGESPVNATATKRRAELLGLLRTGPQAILTLRRQLAIPYNALSRDISHLRQRGFNIVTVKDITGGYYQLLG